MDIEKKMNSKSYRFFDFLYKLLIMNLVTFLLSLLIITAFPAIVSLNATIKNDMDEVNPFKAYFSNFGHYFKKSFLIGLLIIVTIAIICFAFYFYAYAVPQDTFNKIVFQMGVAVMIILMIIVIMLCVHLPLLIVSFTSLTIGETIKTSFYISFRYFLTTLVLFGMFVLKIIGIALFPIWIIFGISLPTFLGIKITKPVYLKFEKIDLEKIMHQAEEDFYE